MALFPALHPNRLRALCCREAGGGVDFTWNGSLRDRRRFLPGDTLPPIAQQNDRRAQLKRAGG